MARRYMTNEIHLAAYVSRNFAGEVQVMGETADGYIIKTKAGGVRQLQKNTIESWSLNEGLIGGMGVDALSDRDKAIAEANRHNDTNRRKERESYAATTKEENMQAYHNQLPETRLAHAQDEAFKKEATGPVEGVHYRGIK
ncbi:MAG: hypothetical protein B7Y23_02820 [Sulfurovum sp. 16-42-52]|jgi:hypothetical protein|nr:MAG: hypothetical protein B7Y23_02820 [Sulfurovum sp. 16-42-52]OZA46177.1 MAG: hypothetical protein B7X80_03250 [Sulfurovum sp. 17-42-90]